MNTPADAAEPRGRLRLATSSNLLGAAAAVAALGADQITKPLAFAYVARHGPVDVAPFLTLTSGWNTGVAFGLATATQPAILISIGVGLSALLALLLVKADTAFEKIAFGMAIGGALANVLDRLRFGGVRDFIDFHWSGWHWPAFNLADAFIVAGLFSLLLPIRSMEAKGG